MIKFEELREQVLPTLMPYGVKNVAVFGSFARGEDTPDSDIDLLVEFSQPRTKPLSLLGWVRLERRLSEKVGRKIDLFSARGVSRNLLPYIEEEMVVLHEETK